MRGTTVSRVACREASGLGDELTSFVGRRRATTEIKRALSESRLVTLTGFAGIGKTRLALHVARELRRVFPEGVHLVELAKTHDSILVPHAVAHALGLRDQSTRDPDTVLADYLADKRMLLVLDNCEHVLNACGCLTTMLLRGAAGLRVLATSREPLGVAAEQVWPVPPLSIPRMYDSRETASLLDTPPRERAALELFEDRAAAVLPGFTLNNGNVAAVARLCQRLDGAPLAIELAAARMRMLSVEQILARLEDRFQLLTGGDRAADARHQTLHAAVDWSFELCTEQERLLWARCSVFASEFDLHAAEDVCAGEGVATEDVFTGIAGLIDKSILTRVEHRPQTRYRMLETIREYGRKRLEETGTEDTLRRRHRDYCLDLAERSDAESAGAHQADWIERLHAEGPNFSAALEYSLNTIGEAHHGARMASALWFYWIADGFVREGRTWLDRALALDTEPSSQRARALWIAGWLAHLHGDRDGALTRLQQSRDLAEQLGDDAELSYAIQFLGDSQMWYEGPERAAPLLDEALARHRASNDWTAPALVIFPVQAQNAGLLGNLDQAMAFLHELQALCAPRGERWVLSWGEWNVGIAWWAAANPRKAAVHASESLRIKRELHDLLGVACCIELLAWVATEEGELQRAAVLFAAVDKMWELIGNPLFGTETLLARSQQAKQRVRKLSDKAIRTAHQQGAQMTHEQAIAYALGSKATEPLDTSPARREADFTLTKREREVAALITAGKSNKEIAAHLVISQRTAETHVEHILTKLGFTSRAQIATWMTQHQQTSWPG